MRSERSRPDTSRSGLLASLRGNSESSWEPRPAAPRTPRPSESWAGHRTTRAGGRASPRSTGTSRRRRPTLRARRGCAVLRELARAAGAIGGVVLRYDSADHSPLSLRKGSAVGPCSRPADALERKNITFALARFARVENEEDLAPP